MIKKQKNILKNIGYFILNLISIIPGFAFIMAIGQYNGVIWFDKNAFINIYLMLAFVNLGCCVMMYIYDCKE